MQYITPNKNLVTIDFVFNIPSLKLLPHHGQFYNATLNEIPVSVHHSKFVCAGHTAVVVEENGSDPLIYIFGGGNDEVSYSTLYIYNMKTKEWFLVSRGTKQQQTKMEYPFERECHTAVLRQSKDKPVELVIFGGLTDMETRLDDLWKFSLINREWQLVKPVTSVKPEARETHSAIYCTKNDSILIYGGWSGESRRLDDIYEFSFACMEWRKLDQFDSQGKPCSFIRSAHSAVYKHSTNSMIIFGGWDGSKRFNSMLEFFIDTHVWREITPNNILDSYHFPCSRTGHRALMTPRETMLISGGFNGKEKYFDLFEFSFTTNTWRRIDLVPTPCYKNVKEHFKGSQYHTLSYSDQLKRVIFYGTDGKKQRMYELNVIPNCDHFFREKLKELMYFQVDVEFVYLSEQTSPVPMQKLQQDSMVGDDGRIIKKRKLTC